ncbi:hypothetical protein [Ramlibacter tataouinensis]|uniref:Candidate membrane protein n=1 Tax=Ramlibacter tataouinensis (strain ATCC BAA-407 / DSM 14655 / LMG 21543 / TTB310) TaxID=365046 RepID=F5XZ29_RAMTT|nr:hypothetical protein [Ramlibacter tataouinensis]AEG92017.1 candidate membrane protein [Ramlibacter tataouinensis TTB310]
MIGLTAIRLAALVAVAYALLLLSGGLIGVAGGGSRLSLSVSLAQPVTWLMALLSLLIAWALWSRYAWGWWLGLAAALFQLWRIVSAIIARPGYPQLPSPGTLLVLGLLVAFLILLFLPRARAACSR